MYLQNHTGLILTEASRRDLEAALAWLRAELYRGDTLIVSVVGNLPTGGARSIDATLDRNGMVTA